MSCRIFLTVFTLGLCVAPTASGQTDTSANVLGYELPGMRNAVVRRGLTYRTVTDAGSPRALTMDVYRPAGPATQRRPALIFVHGGLVARQPGPLPTTWPSYRSWGRLATAAGLVGIVFNHRMTTDENIAEAAGDVTTAMEYVRTNAAMLGVDTDRVCIAVYSAGGPLASVFMREPTAGIRCLVLFYPYLDLEHMRVQSPFRPAHPAAHVDSLVLRYSPAHLLTVAPATLPPIFLAMAGADAIPRLNESIERFMQMAVARRVEIDFMLHRTGAHGFDQRDHDARTREILERAIVFVTRHLRD
ncbi:MAG TPA: alpha/beta hydrolase [Gemmatimonadaceae bacterium]|nr:alpha/beta hydrolase [Gemmatimonadaceae bacterium]